jgi:predicted nucleic acid-binding protein
LEARNVFGRVTGLPKPVEWEDLLSDFNGRIFVDPMNWDRLRQQTNEIFERFSHKTTLGTFDATLLASAQLAGARELLSFDQRLKVIAACLGFRVFPELNSEAKRLLLELRHV